ncbi:hypothetical protein U1Q18_017463 [Sarracenia purpurea var. burkii]
MRVVLCRSLRSLCGPFAAFAGSVCQLCTIDPPLAADLGLIIAAKSFAAESFAADVPLLQICATNRRHHNMLVVQIALLHFVQLLLNGLLVLCGSATRAALPCGLVCCFAALHLVVFTVLGSPSAKCCIFSVEAVSSFDKIYSSPSASMQSSSFAVICSPCVGLFEGMGSSSFGCIRRSRLFAAASLLFSGASVCLWCRGGRCASLCSRRVERENFVRVAACGPLV